MLLISYDVYDICLSENNNHKNTYHIKLIIKYKKNSYKNAYQIMLNIKYLSEILI